MGRRQQYWNMSVFTPEKSPTSAVCGGEKRRESECLHSSGEIILAFRQENGAHWMWLTPAELEFADLPPKSCNFDSVWWREAESVGMPPQ